MNWILGLIGALIGIALSNSDWMLGAFAGFFVFFFLGSNARLRKRLDALERELKTARAQVAVESMRKESTAQADASAAEQIVPIAAVPMPPPVVAESMAPATEPATAAAAHAMQASASEPPPLPVAAQPEAIPREPVVAQAAPRAPAEPGWDDKLTARIKAWFTEGNVPVKIGVLVLFVGVAAALKYAVDQGYFTLPIEVRLALIAAGGIAALLFGWRERERRPAFGLSLQGGALGVLLLTVFSAYRMWNLLPPMATFALVVVLVAGAALLAVLQDAVALAALGFIGGYLAPVLISTGSNNPVGLFSYYAVLNAAVFAVSWKRSWRLLNLIGFAFTFGVGTAWGTKFYRPELFASVEPFLILFFVFYVVIGLLYVIRQTTHRRPWVDGTLVFGTPLLAFPLQAGLLKDDRMELAFSALVVALVYGGLVYWLRRKRDERLLTEAYGALALGFATLAVPLAFSAGTTSSVWALEGAGVAWLGIRQSRKFPWLTGLALQLLAAVAYCIGQADGHYTESPDNLLLLNSTWLGAALIAIAGYVLNFMHDRLRPIRVLPAALFVWATFWWLLAGILQLDLANHIDVGDWRFAMGYFAGTIALATAFRRLLQWPRLGRLVTVCAVLATPMVFAWDRHLGGPLAPATLGVWAAYALAVYATLWITRKEKSRSMAWTHVAWLWTIVLAAMAQADHLAGSVWQLAEGWRDASTVTPLLAATFLLWRMPRLAAWPRAERFGDYRNGWFAPASVLLGLAFLLGLFAEGDAKPLAYLPLLNPLELSLIATGALLYALCPSSLHALRKAWSYAGFAFATSATLRAVHHWHGEPWSADVFDSGMSQMALTVVWSLLGVGSWIIGSRSGDRRLWMGGAVLMGVVLLKLVALDRHYMGNVPGIASFLVVGLLLVGVGYIAPSPPKQDDAKRDESKPDDATGHEKAEST